MEDWDVVNPKDILESSRISLHTDTCKAFVGKKKVDLTITEFNLLACFLKNGGTTLSRSALLSTVWDQSYSGTSRTVDTHIQRLRSKLGQGRVPHPNSRGVGYRMGKLSPRRGQEGVGESFLANRGIWTVARMQNLFVSQGKHFVENALHEHFIGSPG